MASSTLVRPDLLRRLNERRLLDTFRAVGPCSRADLTRHTGISAPTVSRLVASLLEGGIIEEYEVDEARVGRPSKQLRLALDAVQVLGARLGVREMSLFAAGLDGVIDAASYQTLPTPPTYAGILDGLAERVQTLRQRTRRTLGLGISVPGLLDEQQGRVLFSPNLHQTDGQCLADDLGKRIDLEVATIQESRALCLAERLHGGAKDLDDFLVIDISEGVGVGMVLDGRLVVGRQGLAGEFGHMTVDPNGPACGCGNHGCLETLTSIQAIVNRAEQRLGKPVSLAEIVHGARGGDATFTQVIADTLPWLAIGLATLINCFNPEAVFIHGPLAELDGVMLSQLTELTKKRALPASMQNCRLEWAKGSKEQGAVAAAIDRQIGSGPLLE
jgi:N-acetylglucosamine repressor